MYGGYLMMEVWHLFVFKSGIFQCSLQSISCNGLRLHILILQ